MNKTRGNVHFALLGTLLVCLLFAPSVLPDERSAKEKQLQGVLRKIAQLKQAIDVKEDSKSQYIRQLKSIEGKIGGLSQKIRAIDKLIGDKKKELSRLHQTRLEYQHQLSRENDYLAEQVYTAFTLGRQEKIKLLFSQQDPQTLQRNLVYYQYFSNARVDLINDVQDNIERIIETEQLIRQARAALEKNQHELKVKKQELDQDRGKRKSIIAALDKQLEKQGGSLSRLEDEATQLQNLINSIQEIFVDAPENEISRRAFAELRGKLAWPVKGKLKKLFGRNKPLSDLRWQGVMIEAPGGSHVQAVSHGRVAFADWLRGMGNLIIVDHGNSYLSLYGHNEALFKTAGEWVEAGDVIASIGSSGGQKNPGLYFEIREKGKPQNPTRWCKAGNQFTPG